MRRGPKSGARQSAANLGRARGAWGADLPEWVRVLAGAADASGQTAVARRLSYAASVVSQVLSRSYRGDYGAVEQAVRGVLMAARVACPVLGDLALEACLEHQERAAAGVRGSELRIRLAGACPTCPQNRSQQNRRRG